jgi:putative selenium metabolism hydrolase
MTTGTELLKTIPFQDVVSTIQDTINFPTISGKEEALVKHLIKAASRLGFSSAHNDRMGNLITEIVVGDGAGPTIVLSGHLDTVSANAAEWDAKTSPYSGSIIDGRIYGRGASDMKASFCAMLYAAASLQGLQGPYGGKVYVVGTVVEELFEGVCFLEALKVIQPDIVIIGEASEGHINIGQRGRAEIVITSFGQPQHASTGRTVINAIEQTAYIIDAFHVWYRSRADEILGKRNIVPTDIKIPMGGGGGLDGRGGNSTVPNKVEITYDIRTLADDTEESIILLVRENIDTVVRNGREKYPSFRTPNIQYSSERAVTWTGEPIVQKKFAPAWKTSKDCELVVKATKGIEKALGAPPELGHYGFCTDGSGVGRYRELFPERAIEIIGYGPGSESDAHTINESISIEELKKIYLGHQGILLELLHKP